MCIIAFFSSPFKLYFEITFRSPSIFFLTLTTILVHEIEFMKCTYRYQTISLCSSGVFYNVHEVLLFKSDSFFFVCLFVYTFAHISSHSEFWSNFSRLMENNLGRLQNESADQAPKKKSAAASDRGDIVQMNTCSGL